MRISMRQSVPVLAGLTVWLMAGCPMDGQTLVDGASAAATVENNLTGQKISPTGTDAVGAGPASAEEPAQSAPDSAEENRPPSPTPTEPSETPDQTQPGGEALPQDANNPRPFPYPPVEPPADPTPFGVWLLEDGGMLPTFIQGQATFGNVTADVTALILNEDGTGRVIFRDRLTGAKDCVRTFVLFDGDTLVLDFAAETALDVVFNIALDDRTFFFPVVVTASDTLGLAAEDGQIAIFSRQTELPPEVACGELEVVDVFEGLPEPQFFSDLVLFDGDLVYSNNSDIQRFDLDTDTLAAPLATTSSRLVQTTQGAFLWTHCGCGGSRDAFKRTLSAVFDTVSSEDEMGGAITFRAMAYDALNDRLWLHGRSFDSQFGQFFVMNTNGEPDLIDRKVTFNRDLRGLTFDGSDLWGIVTVASQCVVRIDPASGQVLESYEVPDLDVSWGGIVFDDTFMYLLGEDSKSDGVLYRIARP